MLKNGHFAYLTWLAKQTKTYWVIIGIFVFLLGVNVYGYWQEEENNASDERELQAENLIMTVEQNVQPATESREESTEKQVKMTEEKLVAENAPNLPQEIYVNPLDLAGYRKPCTGKVLCNFGVNFDERFGDYRYHQGVVYELSQTEITAALAGTVTNIYQEAAENIVVIDEAVYQLRYHGLREVDVAIGEYVELGQKIGTAEQLLTVEAIEYR